MTQTTETTVAAEAVVAVATPKTPSKKSQAMAIFAAKLEERKQGLYASNKDFRSAVLRAIENSLGVSTASAATMFNAAKTDAEKADPTVALGRDPKKVKVKSEGGSRGRPKGSKNKATETVVVTTTAEEGSGYAEPAAEAVAA